jgi:DNA-binding XRE family transcriptional regulator
MPSIANLLKSEIVRLSRKELKAAIQPLRRIATEQRRAIADLKRQLAELQRGLRASSRALRKLPGPVQEAPAAIRFSPARLANHRAKLELSAAQYGKLVGVTGQTIYNWESGVRPRPAQLETLAAVRKLGKRVALAKLG